MSLPRRAFDAPFLVAPDDAVVDWISLDRMARQLDAAPPEVVGVVAPPGPIASGASYRSHAERRALLPLAVAEIERRGRATGAALLRPGTPHQRDAMSVSAEGLLLVDKGTHVHDPFAIPVDTVAASPHGRSPFPVRPVVLFVCCAAGRFDDRIRALVNGLLAVDVEARLAIAEVPPGPHLTNPCAPQLASLEALAPEIVVPMDEDARGLVRGWGDVTASSPVAIEVVSEGPAVRLLSWRRGSASSPVRARIRMDVEPRAFAVLVNRLSSGPRPLRAAPLGIT